MRILRESDLKVLWSWGDTERDELQRTFQENLVALLQTVRQRLAGSHPLPPQDLETLAREVQEAGDLLHQGMQNCFALAGIFYVLAAPDPAERTRRQATLNRLKQHLGKPVRVTRTSLAELKNRTLILEEIHGIKAVLFDGEDRWETPLDRLEPVEPEPASQAAAAPRTAEGKSPQTPPAPHSPTPASAENREEPPLQVVKRTAAPRRSGPPPLPDTATEKARPARNEAAPPAPEAAPPSAQPSTGQADSPPAHKSKPSLRKTDTTQVLRPQSRTEKARILKKKVLRFTARPRPPAAENPAQPPKNSSPE